VTTKFQPQKVSNFLCIGGLPSGRPPIELRRIATLPKALAKKFNQHLLGSDLKIKIKKYQKNKLKRIPIQFLIF